MNVPETHTGRGPGSVLAAARLRAGLTLNDVAARTRVARPLLESLEAENWDALPAPVYVRGFIKLYAREVGLDARAVLRLLESQTEARVEAEVQAETEADAADRRATWDSIRWRAAYSMAIAIVVVVTLAALFSVSPPRLEARSLRPSSGHGAETTSP
jgi:cytoskeleton protein RodZ